MTLIKTGNFISKQCGCEVKCHMTVPLSNGSSSNPSCYYWVNPTWSLGEDSPGSKLLLEERKELFHFNSSPSTYLPPSCPLGCLSVFYGQLPLLPAPAPWATTNWGLLWCRCSLLSDQSSFAGWPRPPFIRQPGPSVTLGFLHTKQVLLLWKEAPAYIRA